MPRNPRRSSPILPGAWASSWTLSPAYQSDDGEQTLQESAAQITDHAIHNGSISYPHFSKTPNFVESKRTSRADSSYSNGQASGANSYDDDLSDDFYSIISQEDTAHFAVTLNELSEGAERLPVQDLIPVDLSVPVQGSPESSSILHTEPFGSPLDPTLSDNVPSKVTLGYSTHPSAATPCSPTARNGVFLSSGSRLSSSSANDTATSTSSNRGSLSGESCSGRSMVFRKSNADQESTHSNYSGLNYAHVCNLIAQLADGAVSEASLPATPHQRFPRHQNSRQIRRTRIERGYNENEDNNNELELCQPDGNAPWTLSLDPALTATESTTSHSSIISVSTHSYDSQDEKISRRYPPFTSFQSNSFLRNKSSRFSRDNGTHTTESTIAQQESNHSIYAQPTTTPNAKDSIAPPHLREEATVRPKNVIQKTKDLCNKFKRLLVPKKVLKQKEAPVLAAAPLLSESVHADLPPPIQNASPPSSPRTWSFVRRRGFQRSLKTSLPSSQYSPYKQDTTTHNSTASIDKRSYEYHARPKTLQEIRSKRRFSLPAFSGTSPNQHNKSAGQSSHHYRRPRNGSIMTSASQNNSFLMNTLT